MRILQRAAFIIVAALAVSCAKQEGLSAAQIEEASLDAWISAHSSDEDSHAYGAVRHAYGLYTKVLEAAPAGAAVPVEGDWVEIMYTGYSMPNPPLNPTGNVFVTRYADIAHRELGSSNAYHTYYAPHKVLFSLYGGILTEAMYSTIGMMGEGAEWRYYAPSGLTYYGYSSAYSYGYQGHAALAGGAPSYMDIKLVRVIKDVLKDERDSVAAYAYRHLGKELDESLKDYLYLKTWPNDPDNESEDAITEDSKVKIYYKKYFLDGFVFDTNIDSVAVRVFNDHATHSALEYTPSGGGQIQGFYEAVTTMKYDTWGHMVMSSDWAYGYEGDSAPTAPVCVIDPYVPICIEFYIAPYEPKKEE